MFEATEKSGRLFVITPYHPRFPEKARDTGGKWDAVSKSWSFDIRDREAVNALCRRIWGYGFDDEKPELVDIKLTLEGNRSYGSELWIAGRQVARRPGRDSVVRLGPGVVIAEGSFASRGGSTKYPDLQPRERVILVMRDIPRPAVERAMESQAVTNLLTVEILERNSA